MRWPLGPWPAQALAWLTERLYRELAWAYDAVAWAVSLGQWSRWRRQALPYLAGERILEIGFGTGTLLLEMRRRGMGAIGVDVSPEMHRVTSRRARSRGLTVATVLADARALPFASRSFDSILATFPAGCILSQELMAEAARVLVPAGGRFVVAGLYVESDSPLLRLPSLLVNGGDVRPAVSRFERVAAAAGFAAKLAVEQGRGFRLPVYVLERAATEPAACPEAAHGDG